MSAPVGRSYFFANRSPALSCAASSCGVGMAWLYVPMAADEIPAQKSLLDGAVEHDRPVPRSCASGVS
jgi:hypothetical protein